MTFDFTIFFMTYEFINEFMIFICEPISMYDFISWIHDKISWSWIHMQHFMTYEFRYAFMYMKNIVKSYLKLWTPKFQMNWNGYCEESSVEYICISAFHLVQCTESSSRLPSWRPKTIFCKIAKCVWCVQVWSLQ